MLYYTEPKYVKMAEEIKKWYDGITESSETYKDCYKKFFTELPKVAGNSITKKAIAINILYTYRTDSTEFNHWKTPVDINLILQDFKIVRTMLKRKQDLDLIFMSMKDEIMYCVNPKTGELTYDGFLGEIVTDTIREDFRKHGLELDDRGNVIRSNHIR